MGENSTLATISQLILNVNLGQIYFAYTIQFYIRSLFWNSFLSFVFFLSVFILIFNFFRAIKQVFFKMEKGNLNSQNGFFVIIINKRIIKYRFYKTRDFKRLKILVQQSFCLVLQSF